ncbi:fumarate hydratase [Thermocladium modestius]|uniref:Fumarate hydratase n=1 Tax=Thermocladium modestius TaxID=62609 RepID=A0A830GU18_9CREN|nr:FumA C-terminus/TtdB family hydratase beta subunit [Thermocladium modestius]GGP20170.1 fumarate hydratase [Thermocladium modestius]
MEYRLRTPIAQEDVEKLRVGDTIYVSGIIVTARDSAHVKMLEELRSGRGLPVDLRGGAIYHAGPVALRSGDKWRILSAGPTTSARMEEFEAEVIERTGVKLIIGKGGMGDKTSNAMKTHKAAYAVFPGGAGVLAAQSIKEVLGVHWLDELGMAEAMWVLRVEDFGPMTVAIDSTGSNLYADLKMTVRKNEEAALKEFRWRP